MYAIGLDIGTTSVCGILHDAASGEVIKTRTEKNDSFLALPNDWAKEQDPNRLLTILKTIADDLLAEGKEVFSIGLTGQMHGIVYLNADGKPVSSLRIWQDGRGNLPYKDCKTYAAYMSEKTAYALATGYGSVTYFYDSINNLVPADAVTFCNIHDLAAMMLTGRKSPLLHPSDAAALGLFDLTVNAFDQDAIRALGLNPALFPAVASGFAVAGEYNGIPVSVALGDNQASFLGSVADMDESLLVNVGTGSQISCLVHAVPESELDCRPLLDGSYIMAGSSLCGGRAYAILERFLREAAETITGMEVASAYPAMDRLMAEFDTVSAPLAVTTTFSGTRTKPEERGRIENIGIDNLTMATLSDGVLVGMVNELHDMYRQILPFLDGKKSFMVGSGNGIRFNGPLKKRFERIFDLPMRIPAHKEEAAFGASLYALVAAGIYPNIEQAQKLIRYQ